MEPLVFVKMCNIENEGGGGGGVPLRFLRTSLVDGIFRSPLVVRLQELIVYFDMKLSIFLCPYFL